MPGHLISAECICGFAGDGSPGGSDDGQVYVMAYDPNRTAQNAADILITVPEDEAFERGLSIIKDPVMEHALGRIHTRGPWGGYRCPVCRNDTMTLAHAGYWD